MAADGIQVTLLYRTWRDHIQLRHPEVTLPDIAQALTNTLKVCAHRQYPDQQIYEGHPGTTMYGSNIFPVVVVERLNNIAGVVVTARVSRRSYRGVQRWP
jgi:hypothetical protein